MTEKIICDVEDLTAIADAVRASTGSTETYNVSELSEAAVNAIGSGGVEIDDTLTVAGAAADAKATGTKIAALSEEIAKLPSGGGGAAIIDVVALPETDIDEDVFYRVLTGAMYYNQAIRTMDTCYVVETLPETGEPAVTPDMSVLTVYYARNTGTASAYLTPQVADVFGYPAGWYPAEALMAAAQMKYGGIVSSLNEMTEAETFYLLIQDVVKYHNDDKWHNLQGIGWAGEVGGAERFNSLLNVASGGLAHAEGLSTTASGNASHAEGYYTRAHSGSQHVQGRINIADEEGKFAHIVGNGRHRPGTTDMPSNAHTLDWDGNAWFSGSVYVGSNSGVNRDEGSMKLVANGDDEIILTSPNGTRYKITVNDDGTLTAMVVTE